MFGNGKDLTIEVAGKQPRRVSLRSFLLTMHGTVRAIQALDRSMHGREAEIAKWEVTDAGMRNPLFMTIAPTLKTGGAVIGEYLDGLKRIRTGRRLPRSFDTTVFTYTQKAMSVLSNGVASLRLRSGRTSVMSDANLAVKIQVIQSEEYNDISTLEGTLEAVSVHGRDPRFSIYDSVTHQPIRCFFLEADLSRVKEYLPGRVTVTGRVYYNKLKQPTRIRVHEFERIESDSELPDLEDLGGINLTDGLGAAEHIRRLRDEQ